MNQCLSLPFLEISVSRKVSLKTNFGMFVEFTVNPQAIEMLKAVKGPISLISLVGPYNSGKSSLGSRALLDNATAFKAG